MGSKGSSTTKQSYSLPPEFQAAYKKSIDMATAATSQPYQAYQGQLVAGLNPTQLQGISNVNAAQGMALPAIGRGMQLTERAAQGITPELYNQFYSPYVRDVADTTFANMMESAAQQRSGLKGGAIQAGAFGGDRAGIAAAEMARQQQLGLGQTMSGIYNQGYGQAMQLAGQQAQNYGAMGQQLAGLGVGAQGSVLQGAQAQLAAGAQQQATDQAQLQAAYEQWMQRQAYPYQQAQFFANIAQGLGAGAGGTSTTTTPGPSLGSQILGGIGAIGSIFSGSDERMKENIEAVGTLNDGQTIYRYNFKGDPKTQIGLLAQEVETREPGAVAEVSGLKMVNYKDATDKAASMGGLVTPDMERQNFAEGGVPYYPYAALGYVPEGKIGRGGVGIPSAPEAFKDEGLSKDWKEIMPLTKEQVSGLKSLADKLGIVFDRPEKSALGHLGDSEDYIDAPKFEDEYPDKEYYTGFASGGVAGRNGYLMGGEPTMEDAMEEAGLGAAEAPAPASEGASEFKYPTNPEVEAYIAQAAAKRGIDPEVAIRVWRSEGASGDPREGWQSKVINKEGKRERSFGPYQLYMEGGLGNEMEQATGLSPADPRNWRPSVDFALDKAAEGGWGPWAGAKAIGLDPRAGLAGARSAGEYSEPAGGVIAPMADTEAVMPEEPRSRFSLNKLFASDENPSIIETIMGRRLSPEARAAVMNASFAMLAGRSPFMGVNIGEAGKVGMQTYYNALQQKQAQEQQAAEQAQQQYGYETNRMVAETARDKAIREQAQEVERQRIIDAAIAQLPLNQQAAARLAPEKFFGAQAESLFKTPTDTRSFAPIPYTRTDGTIGYGIPRDDGTFIDIETPEGAEFLSPFEKARQTSSGAAEGKITTEQALSAASDIQAADQALNVLDQIVSSPYIEQGTGFSSYANIVRGTGGYDFQNLVEQAKSGAFLTAIEQLRGMGALSNAEGSAATSAITRMDTSTSKEAFLKAVADYRALVEKGRERAEKRIRASSATPNEQAVQDAGPEYTFNPETGELE